SLALSFTNTSTTDIYTLSLHDALPISRHWGHAARWNSKSDLPPKTFFYLLWLRPLLLSGRPESLHGSWLLSGTREPLWRARKIRDRKSTRLNSSHEWISYAVFCLKKNI